MELWIQGLSYGGGYGVRFRAKMGTWGLGAWVQGHGRGHRDSDLYQGHGMRRGGSDLGLGPTQGRFSFVI